MSNEPTDEEELFSEDPEEQLRIENEILKMRLKAELGGDFEPLSEVPAEIENLFLKNVLAFEHEHANAEVKTIFELLDKPAFKKEAELNDAQLVKALHDLESLLDDKGIAVDYLVDYPARIKYTFLTEELFLKEASMMTMPGMTMHYLYEEYHPNHEYEIRRKADYFIKHWFEQSFDEQSSELSESFVAPTSDSSISREQLFTKFGNIFDSYDEFKNEEYTVDEVSFELIENNEGLGFADGNVSYDAVMENGETIRFSGPFKFYFQMEDDYWSISYFNWPGFGWDNI